MLIRFESSNASELIVFTEAGIYTLSRFSQFENALYIIYFSVFVVLHIVSPLFL